MSRPAGRRCGSSRTLGTSKQCAIYERGDRCCVWCGVQFVAPKPWGSIEDDPDSDRYATVDHLDGDPKNNAPENLVPSCNGCNVSRSYEWDKGREWEMFDALANDWYDFDLYLIRKGTTIEEAINRVEWQRWIALDMNAGRALAAIWHAERVAYKRAWDKAHSHRRKANDNDRRNRHEQRDTGADGAATEQRHRAGSAGAATVQDASSGRLVA